MLGHKNKDHSHKCSHKLTYQNKEYEMHRNLYWQQKLDICLKEGKTFGTDGGIGGEIGDKASGCNGGVDGSKRSQFSSNQPSKSNHNS